MIARKFDDAADIVRTIEERRRREQETHGPFSDLESLRQYAAHVKAKHGGATP